MVNKQKTFKAPSTIDFNSEKSIELKRLDCPLCEFFGICSIYDRTYEIVQISVLDVMFMGLLIK